MSDIANLIEALDRNTASQTAVVEAMARAEVGRAAALEAADKITGAAAPKTRAKAADKAAEPATAEPVTPAATTNPYAGDEGFQKLRSIPAGYLGVDDEAEQNARSEKFAALLQGFGVTKLGEIPEDKRPDFAAQAQALADAGNVLSKPASGGLLD